MFNTSSMSVHSSTSLKIIKSPLFTKANEFNTSAFRCSHCFGFALREMVPLIGYLAIAVTPEVDLSLCALFLRIPPFMVRDWLEVKVIFHYGTRQRWKKEC